jgi:hypothetical protein
MDEYKRCCFYRDNNLDIDFILFRKDVHLCNESKTAGE